MFKRLIYAWHQMRMALIYTLLCFSCSTTLVNANPNGEGIKSYQKNLHLSPVHMKKLAEDIHRYRSADNIWDILREEFSLPHYANHPAVQERIEWCMRNQVYLLRSAARAAPYLYYILQQVRKRHLPTELVLLPIIESGYNPFSISNMGAAGIWQIMPDPATSLGIRQDNWYDGRRDIIASTRGALNHLAYLESFFDGNWLLAIAAYNTGEGNVLAAIKRNIREGRRTDFWSLPVAQETRDYVPSLLALAIIISHPEKYPLFLPPVRNAPYLAQVDLDKRLNLKSAATLAGMSYKKLIQLNPGFNRPNASNRIPYKLVLPIENVQRFSENAANEQLKERLYRGTYQQSTYALTKPKSKMKEAITVALKSIHKKKYTLQPGDTIYMVRTNETLESIAKRYHLKKQDLLSSNQLSNNPKVGTQIILPTHLVSTKRPKNVNLSSNEKVSDGTIYIVKKGDTIESIARQFGLSAAAIRVANLMTDNAITEEDQLIIPPRVHA